MIVTSITQGVKVSVETFYQPDFSNSKNSEFVFAYRITIENNTMYPVSLLRRHWHIYDVADQWREVEGEGVVGEQPKIEAGSRHQYVSGCHLIAPAGKMYGSYLMRRESDNHLFEVRIPEFQMIAPALLN